jgi:hypothetical protein
VADHDSDDQAPTLVAHSEPAPSLPGSAEAPITTPGATLTASRAIREEQALRGAALVRIGAGVGATAALLLQLPPGQDPTGKLIATLALSGIAVASFALIVGQRFGYPIDPRRVFWLSLVITPAIVATMWHVGVMSPTVMALIFGIYYFGLSDDKVEGWVNYLIAAVGFGAISVLTIVGIIPADRALFPLVVEPVSVLAMSIVVELMLLTTFSFARLSRRATIDAMVKLESARRQIHERDALLDEVAADLQHVLGAGKRGRFSGQKVGDYVAELVIGRGAMGEVYRASRADGSKAALKVLHACYSESDVYVERFFREAMVTSALASPHIVKVFDHGVSADGCPFLGMELLEGHDLAWHLRQRRRFSIKDALRLINELAQGLAVARDEGIVHRDMKPKNVFLDERDRPVWKILDFGISKIHASSGTLTQGDIVGTPAYMAPEQAKQGEVDHRADVFALGAIAYRVITGRPPWAGDQPVALMYRVATQQPHQPGALVRLNADIDLALVLALAKDRERRIRSATSFAAALRDAARGELDERFRHDARALLAEQPWAPLASQRTDQLT